MTLMGVLFGTALGVLFVVTAVGVLVWWAARDTGEAGDGDPWDRPR